MKTTITARCRIVTPMMSAGADQQQFEIRASEMKAGLRFWWRVFQPLEGQDLFKKEKTLFGSTEEASHVRISVDWTLDGGKLWGPGTVHGWGLGTQYVFFAINSPYQRSLPAMNDKPARPERQAQIKKGLEGRTIAKPGGEFFLRLRLDRLDRYGPKEAGDLLCALWLLENIGGLGGRTRRGAGCFEILELKVGGIEWNENGESRIAYGDVPRFSFHQNEIPEAFIREGINTVKERWGRNSAKTILSHTSFYNPGTEIFVPMLNGVSASDVLEQVGLWFKDYCFKNPLVEAQEMHAALDRATLPAWPNTFTLRKAAKGLPIIYNFRGTKDKYTATFDDGGKEGRRASPLLISCHERGGKGYAVACHFPAQLLPPGKDLLLKMKPSRSTPQGGMSWNRTLPAPDQSFVKEMLHRPRPGKDRNGNNKTIQPLCGNFETFCNADSLNRKPATPEEKKEEERKIEFIDLTPAVGELFREIEAMKTPDTFRIDIIIEHLEKIQGIDAKGASTVAKALKEKLFIKKELWKKYRQQIEFCILD